jgi:hypothetical protein
MQKSIVSFFSLLMLGFGARVTLGEELIQAPAAIQITSVVSDGKYSVPEIVTIARRNGIKVVITTDRDLMRWQYGLWPLRAIFKKTVEDNSISRYGVSRYLKGMEDVENRNRDLVVISGVESAPFYYWEGRPFSKTFKIKNWHKHMLVFGLRTAGDFKNLPAISNGYSIAEPFRYKDVFRFWPLLFLCAGGICLGKRKFGYRDQQGNPLGPYSRGWRVAGVCCITLGLLFLYNDISFRGLKYDQYHGDRGVKPYQNLIEYVHQKGGLTFWSHPEAEYIREINGVGIETGAHWDDLLTTDGYTGFSIFYEGYAKVGHPGGIWDEILTQYCNGARNAPVWAIGGLSFDQAGDLGKSMNDLRTVVLVPQLNKPEVLRALKEGRMYVVKGKDAPGFILDAFTAGAVSAGVEKIMGQLLETQEKPQIRIRGSFSNGQIQAFKIRLIRNGKIIKAFETVSPFDIAYQDEDNAKDGKISYYRIEAQSEGVFAVTNPVFVRQK